MTAAAPERVERFAGESCLQLGDRFLELQCTLNARQRYIQGVPTRISGFDGKFENLPFFEARKAILERKSLSLTLENGERFRVAIIDTEGSFTAAAVD